jgi:hypothetical protein
VREFGPGQNPNSFPCIWPRRPHLKKMVHTTPLGDTCPQDHGDRHWGGGGWGLGSYSVSSIKCNKQNLSRVLFLGAVREFGPGQGKKGMAIPYGHTARVCWRAPQLADDARARARNHTQHKAPPLSAPLTLNPPETPRRSQATPYLGRGGQRSVLSNTGFCINNFTVFFFFSCFLYLISLVWRQNTAVHYFGPSCSNFRK